jgi:hypothetical protein
MFIRREREAGPIKIRQDVAWLLIKTNQPPRRRKQELESSPNPQVKLMGPSTGALKQSYKAGNPIYNRYNSEGLETEE